MAEFSKLVITDTGQALLAKMIAGSSNIRFTKVSTSSATYDEMQLQGLDTLSDVKQTSVISGVSRTNETAIEVEAAFTNADLMEGYHMRALGLYAVDPDEGEILYAVAKELSGCCYMPAYNGVTLSGIILTLVTTVGNAESVSLEVTPAGIATYKDIQAVQTEIQSVRAQLGNHTVKSDVPAGAVFSDMVGATAETAGAAGYVPAPGAGKQTKEHFTLSEQDQTSLMGLQTQVVQGVDNIPWHTSDQTQPCRYYSNADMALIVTAAMQYVTYHVTYYRDLRIYIRSLDNKDEVNTVYYGMEIPPEYQSEPLRDMLSAMAAGGTDAED